MLSLGFQVPHSSDLGRPMPLLVKPSSVSYSISRRCNIFTQPSVSRVFSGIVRPQRHSRPLSSPISAALWSLPDDISHALHVGTSLAIVLGIGFSALPILTGDSKERNERRFLQPTPEQGAENIRWGVMYVLAFLPFLNPMVSNRILRISTLITKTVTC